MDLTSPSNEHGGDGEQLMVSERSRPIRNGRSDGGRRAAAGRPTNESWKCHGSTFGKQLVNLKVVELRKNKKITLTY